jgi:hypothetical protein
VLRKGWKNKRKLNRDEYAKKCGVSKMAISKAARAGKVVEDDKGHVDITNPVNRAYMLADHTVMKRARAAGKKPTTRADDSKRKAKLYEAKTVEQTRQYKANADWAIQRRAKDLGLLVECVKVEQMMAAFGAELKLRILGLPRQVSGELFDLAQTKGSTPMAIEGLLLKLLTDALVHCKEKAREVGLDTDGR